MTLLNNASRQLIESIIARFALGTIWSETVIFIIVNFANHRRWRRLLQEICRTSIVHQDVDAFVRAGIFGVP